MIVRHRDPINTALLCPHAVRHSMQGVNMQLTKGVHMYSAYVQCIARAQASATGLHHGLHIPDVSYCADVSFAIGC
jgi:hypothetical protein